MNEVDGCVHRHNYNIKMTPPKLEITVVFITLTVNEVRCILTGNVKRNN